MMSNLKICSMNVRGLTDKQKRFDTLNWLKQKRLSIYCLQDIHIGPNNENAFKQDWGGEVIFNSVSSESRGVAVVFGDKINYKIKNMQKDEFGNLLVIHLLINNTEMILVVLYGPNKDTPSFYSNIKDILTEKENYPVVICGDWNLVIDFHRDTFGYKKENNINSRKMVEELIEIFDLSDTWRCSNSDATRYTWISSKRPIQMARLDFFLVTSDFHAKINKYIMNHGFRTDHSFIGIEINLVEISRGKGFWKFNTSLLHDKEYVEKVKKEIQSVILDYSTNENNNLSISHQMLFEMLKLRIRGLTIPFCAKRKNELSEKENNLEKRINKLQDDLMKDPLIVSSNPNFINNLEKYKEDLEILRQPKIEAVRIRCKANIYENFE